MPNCVCGHPADAHPDELHVDSRDEDETVFPCAVCGCGDYDPTV